MSEREQDTQAKLNDARRELESNKGGNAAKYLNIQNVKIKLQTELEEVK